MNRGFTILEIIIAIVLAMMVISMAIPSLSGVLEGQQKMAGYDAFNDLVQEARIRSMEERRPWVLEWREGAVVLRPELPGGGEEKLESFEIPEGVALRVEFPSALIAAPQPVWTFWPSGNAEAAVVSYTQGKAGWVARYHPLTVRAEVEAL